MSARVPRALSVELRLQRPALDIRAQFRVLPARVCALVGHPGSGKSSLLQATAGLLTAKGGRIALGNDVLYDSAADIDLPAHARGIGWLDAHGRLFPHMSVRHNLLYGTRWQKTSGEASGLDDALLQQLDLTPLLERRPDQLSAAQTQTVALARALMARPAALLLDDPLARVPDEDRPALLERLAELVAERKLPVVMASPRMNEVIRLADELVILHEGRMASAGPTAQLLSDVSLSTFLEGVHAGSVLEGTVRHHDLTWLLTEVDVGGQRVLVPALQQPVGQRVRLKLRARDISLHREVPDDTTASNHLRGRVIQIMLAGEHGTYGAVAIELDQTLDAQDLTGPSGPTVWAMLTRRAIQQMGWAPGQPCVLSFKAMATAVSPWR